MMRQSHRHARMLWHLLCPQAVLYTEMAPAAAVARNRGHAHRHDSASTAIVVLQVAGCDPAELATAARRGEELGFSAINLNCGCPSSRVTAGNFGACMMATPALTARCVAAMRAACTVPITVKCRIAVDNQNPTLCLPAFAQQLRDAGCSGLIVHARKAWLGGLNPKQNRSRPPLEPARVVTLKQAFPELEIITNGEIDSVVSAETRSAEVDGVMLGRAIVARPTLLAEFAVRWFHQPPVDLCTIIVRYLDYCSNQLTAGEHPRRLLTPLAPLAAGRPGGRHFRREVTAAAASGALDKVLPAWA